MKTTKTVWGWVWSGGMNDMRAQAKDSMCATKDDARAEADEFADREFGDEPRGDLGLMEFCSVCWEPTGKCECAE
jgi:hypothetical protein